MLHTVSVTVRVDIDQGVVQLAITGCLTAESHHCLIPLILRARGVNPFGMVLVDLTAARHIEEAGLTSLRSAIEIVEHEEPGQPVRFLTPEVLPPCLMADAAAGGEHR